MISGISDSVSGRVTVLAGSFSVWGTEAAAGLINGIGDMPMTTAAREAFQRQIEETPGSEYLFPSPKSTGSKPYITNLRKHHEPAKGVGGNAEEGGRSVFRALRVAAYLRHSSECWRRRQSYGDSDAAAGQ